MADLILDQTGEVLSTGFASSAALGNLATALAVAQGSIGAVTKGKKAQLGDKYSYTYADLAACLDVVREPLTSNGLALIQGAACHGNKVTVTTRLIHKSGEWIESALTLSAKDASPQAIGSAVTYGRRYGLSALVGLAAEDDDGKAAQPHPVGMKNELPPEPVAPKGFQDWLDDLASTADNGYPAFAHAWKAAPADFRAYGTAQHKATLTALRKRAEAVKVIA